MLHLEEILRRDRRVPGIEGERAILRMHGIDPLMTLRFGDVVGDVESQADRPVRLACRVEQRLVSQRMRPLG